MVVGQRAEAPLVPPYRFCRPNKAMALTTVPWDWNSSPVVGTAQFRKIEADAR